MKMNRRSGVSEVVATLLLIIIAVAAVVLVYAFVTGYVSILFGVANPNGGSVSGTSVEQGQGLVLAQGYTTNGVLEVTLWNNGYTPITGMTLTFPSNMVNPATGTGSFSGFYLNGKPLGPSNSLGRSSIIGTTQVETTDGSDVGVNVPAYGFTLTVTYAGGLTSTQFLSVNTSIVQP